MISAILSRFTRKESASQMAKHDTVNPPTTSTRPLIDPASDRILGGRTERPGNRIERPEPIFPSVHEEVLVVDDRAALRPAQVVESKLTRLLQEASLPVSHLQMRGLLRAR
jgi:hypothetical protein